VWQYCHSKRQRDDVSAPEAGFYPVVEFLALIHALDVAGVVSNSGRS
jgi:hypothetical protein